MGRPTQGQASLNGFPEKSENQDWLRRVVLKKKQYIGKNNTNWHVFNRKLEKNLNWNLKKRSKSEKTISKFHAHCLIPFNSVTEPNNPAKPNLPPTHISPHIEHLNLVKVV